VIGEGLPDTLHGDPLGLRIGLRDHLVLALLDGLDVAHLLHRVLARQTGGHDRRFQDLA